ncbi:MAG: hypothetical protein RL014_2634 [Pseudomonadota bacterium]|jgi:rhamnosyltransferase
MIISSITITYNPSPTALENQLKNLAMTGCRTLVIDNGSESSIHQQISAICRGYQSDLISLEINTGVGHAQNIGISKAIEQGSEFVLILDQDSLPTQGLVETLIKALNAFPTAAAAGPSTYDPRTLTRSFFLLDSPFWPTRWFPRDNHSQPIEVAFLIASGTMLRASAISDQTLMRSDFFIDHVDTEWSFRIRAAGWKLLGAPDAVLNHEIGDKFSRLWFLRWRHVFHHSPLRDYYMFRNSILLIHENYVPFRWKIFFIYRLFQFFFYFLTFAPQRLQRAKAMMQGILHGVMGRTGPRNRATT